MAAPQPIGPARLEIALDRPGRHRGTLYVPYSHDRSAYGRIVLPVTIIQGAPGPTLLLTGGVHGDEYEGPVALTGLAQSLDPETLAGRVIILPMANPPAVLAGRRTSPLDGGNLARSFDGAGGSTITGQIAEGIARLLLPLADCLVDLHSGGRTLEYLPSTLSRIPADPALAARVLAAQLAFRAPYALASRASEANGTLVAAALARNIPAFATELGGAGGLSPASMRAARNGIFAVMRHLDMLAPGDDELPPSRLMLVEPDGYARTPHAGIFEPFVVLGDSVAAEQATGDLWDLNRPELAPTRLLAPATGLVVCRRVPAPVEPGDVVYHLARDADEADILGR